VSLCRALDTDIAEGLHDLMGPRRRSAPPGSTRRDRRGEAGGTT
jgi:hypothetical protein